MTVVCSKTGP